MKLYYGAGACSMGIHLLLEEIGKPYEAIRLDLKSGDNQKPPFIELNPKGKVPTLQRDDGSVLTEYPVIAHHLAKANPEAGLHPGNEEDDLRAAEAVDYCVATIHMQGFSRIIRPGNFAPSEADHEKVQARGRELAQKGFALMDEVLAGKEWITGRYSYADSALFYVSFWGRRFKLQLPPNVGAHLDRMLARPAVQRMLEQEGVSL